MLRAYYEIRLYLYQLPIWYESIKSISLAQAASKAGQFNGKRLVLAWYSAVQHTKRNSTSTNDSSTPAKVQRRETRRSSVSSLLSKDDKDDDDYDLVCKVVIVMKLSTYLKLALHCYVKLPNF